MGENLKAVLASLKKSGRLIDTAANYRGLDITRIPSGIFSLDFALGGGWPMSRVNLITGKKGSGKSTVCLKTVANAQKICRQCRRVHVHTVQANEILKPIELLTWLKQPKDVYGKWLRDSLGKDVQALIESVPTEVPIERFVWPQDILDAINVLFTANQDVVSPLKDGKVDGLIRKLKLELPKELSEFYADNPVKYQVDVNRWVFNEARGHLGCGYFSPMVCAWLDAEGVFEKKWAGLHDVDMEALYLSRTETAEEAADILVAFLRSGDVDLIVVDSVANLVPSIEIEDSFEKQQVGVQARIVNKLSRNMISAQAFGNRTFGKIPTMLMINQERMKVGVMYGDPTTNPGGMGLPFATSVGVKMWPGKTIKDADLPILQELKFNVNYNKVSTPGIDGEFKLLLADVQNRRKGEIWEEEQILAMAIKYNYIPQDGKTYTFYGREFKRQDDITTAWLEDRVFFEKFKKDFLVFMLDLL